MMESTTKQVKVQTLFPPFCRWRRSGLQVKAWTLLVQHWLLLWSGRDGVKFAHVVLKYFRAQWVPGECSRAWWELFKSKHECLEDSWFRISDHQTPSPLYNATVSTELCKSIQLSETGPIIGSQWDPWDPGGRVSHPTPTLLRIITLLMKHSRLYVARIITPASHWPRLYRPRTGDEVLLVRREREWGGWGYWINGDESKGKNSRLSEDLCTSKQRWTVTPTKL